MGRTITAPSLGFTGTRRGMTFLQFQAVCRLLVTQDGPESVDGVEVVRHGDAVGGDADFARIVRWIEPAPKVVVHPRDGDDRRAHTPADAVEPVASALDRARAIVDGCDVLLACPPEAAEESRSGTWGTIHYARRAGKQVILVYPDGSVAAGGVLHFLTVDRTGPDPVHVFLIRDPREEGHPDLSARPVSLEFLPPDERTGAPEPVAVRPVLGRSARDPNRYREFRTKAELDRAGFVRVGQYRVCDGWDDYRFPRGAANDPHAIGSHPII